MNRVLSTVAAISLLFGTSASAHRLDEYLQATIISVQRDRIHTFMRLVPGVAVSSIVLSSIDTNSDGVISETEQQAYAQHVFRDLSLTVDGEALHPRLVSVAFPKSEEMKEGLGEIQIEFTADLPSGGAHRKLIFENQHQSRIAAYLVNCLVPSDKNIQITAQNRNQNQSFYQLNYTQLGVPDPSFVESSLGDHASLPGMVASLVFWFAGFAGMFRLGIRHIAEGTDHLLFLLTLLLPAPLLALDSRWGKFAGARRSVLQILKVVTAFTVGHSITLALAALAVIRVPSRPIEVLIAVSILISAAHALRPFFAGRESVIAAFFGLIHGLAFAATLGQLGLGRWERITGILGFNLGIETMQLIVIVAIMPSLVLLSRTRAYSILRIGGALFAGFASLGWIAERLLSMPNAVDVVVNRVAHHAVWIAGVLFLSSLTYWSHVKVVHKQSTMEPLS